MELQIRIENILSHELDTQFDLIRHGTSAGDTIIQDICEQRRILMAHSGLLMVVGDLAEYTSVVWGRRNSQSQRVLVGGTGATPGPFSIRENMTYFGTILEGQRSELAVYVGFGTLTKNIRNTASPTRLRMTGGPTSPAAFRGVDEMVRRRDVALVNARIAGAFYDTFQLGVVYVIETGRVPQTLVWPTVYSYVSLNALNNVVLGANRYLDAITWEQFLQKPDGQALDWFMAAVPTHIKGTGYTWTLFDLNDFDIALVNNLSNNLITPALTESYPSP